MTQLLSTGLPFFDRFLGGGQSAGEVYGLLGPYGSGKTTLGCMLAVEAARGFAARSMQSGGDKAMAVVVSFEEDFKAMQLRVMGYAAEVSSTSLRSSNRSRQLSRRGRLADYERQLYAQAIGAGENPPGEAERIQAAEPWLKDHILLVDLKGLPVPKQARNGVEEIEQLIAGQVIGRRRSRCGLIVIDYVGAMARRTLAYQNRPPGDLRHLIGQAPMWARSDLAAAFNCPVWLIHQLSGEANGRSPGSVADHTDAAEARDFGESLDFAFVLGNPLDGQTILACTKHRRTPAMGQTVLRIDGELFRMVPGGESNGLGLQAERLKAWLP